MLARGHGLGGVGVGKMRAAARMGLFKALARRYAGGTDVEKRRILDEFEAVSGVHRRNGPVS